MQEVETMSKYEYMLEQTEVIKKKVMEAGSAKEAVEILLNACNIFNLICQKSSTS